MGRAIGSTTGVAGSGDGGGTELRRLPGGCVHGSSVGTAKGVGAQSCG